MELLSARERLKPLRTQATCYGSARRGAIPGRFMALPLATASLRCQIRPAAMRSNQPAPKPSNFADDDTPDEAAKQQVTELQVGEQIQAWHNGKMNHSGTVLRTFPSLGLITLSSSKATQTRLLDANVLQIVRVAGSLQSVDTVQEITTP
jgi:hypothetical protein